MQPHEQRLVEEKTKLDENLSKLNNFVAEDNPVFLDLPGIERALLNRQVYFMERYLAILELRIELFRRPK